MQKTITTIEERLIIEQAIEQGVPAREPSANFSREELDYLEMVSKRDNDRILQTMVWK